ncbi:hypothetical protein Ddc_02764 [Ditylenchus destructor]|nr:hypothetical protein Ddc_02764 [Ditylenchus destructor]
MKYILPFSLLVLFALAAAKDAHSEESKEDESKETTQESDGKIRQCTCTELHDCGEKMHEQVRPCLAKCVEELSNSDWDGKAGKQCFVPKQPRKKHCFEEIKKQTCALEDGVMMNKNETFRGIGRHRLGHGHHKNGSNDEEHSVHHGGHHGGHHKRGFFTFVKKNFGDSGKKYVSCMKGCFRAHKRGHCVKNLGCGVKKLSREQMKSGMEKCRAEKTAHRQELCECLQKAGMKNIDCTTTDSHGDSESAGNNLN